MICFIFSYGTHEAILLVIDSLWKSLCMVAECSSRVSGRNLGAVSEGTGLEH